MITTPLLALAALSLTASEPDPAVRETDTKPWYLENALYPYEPVYVLMSTKRFDAKFQLSFSFRLIGNEQATPEGSDRPWGLYAAFSQTSLWDLTSESKPFFDSSYRPEAWWHQNGLPSRWLGAYGLDVDAGGGHESNGQAGALSRTLNILYIRPIARWDLGDEWRLVAQPKIYAYVTDLSENPDIAEYRGYVDLNVRLGVNTGWQVDVRGRVGRDYDRGSLQVDVSHPIDRLTGRWINAFGYAQLFTGYGESLRTYDRQETRVLLGIGVVR